ncbi:MAG: endonuclease/exonuclease/phosphatase family protein [Candidatus Taylorbacteria bacterium]|nr:endonuclease/exonuclease/phosphatase family protein [Candidatus Taylorbacteria bacterium]
MTTLKILTWNTDLSPSMYDRIKRKNELLARIGTYNGNYDVLCFQELTSFAVGFITYSIYSRFSSLFNKNPWLLCLWDYLMITEGSIYPYRYIDNQGDVIDIAKSLGYEHSIRSQLPKRYINSGLVILSRFPISNKRIFFPPHDMIHRPSTILAELDVHGKTVHIGSSYFVPDLHEPKPTYALCNIINFICGKNPRQLRHNHLCMIRDNIRGKRVILVGDFNITRGKSEYSRMLETLELSDACRQEVGTFRGFFNNHNQIDYILISDNIVNLGAHVDHKEHISDHYPLHAELELI